MLLATITHLAQGAGAVASRFLVPTITMPILNPWLVAGGAVAAVIVVSKYPMKRGDAKAQMRGRVGAFFVTAMPGIIFAQVVYDFAVRQWPILASIQSAPVGAGLFLGGCGLPFVLGLYKRLPGVLTERALSLVPKPQGTINQDETDTQ